MSVFDGLRFRKVYSPIHDLDPRIKFVYVIAIFVVAILFCTNYPVAFAVSFADSFCFVGSCSKTVASFAAGSRFFGNSHFRS